MPLVKQHLDWLKRLDFQDETERHAWIQEWLLWALVHRYACVFKVQKKPVGYMIYRPIWGSWVFKFHGNGYFEHLTRRAPDGNMVWIDSVWAPHFYGCIVEQLRATGKEWVGWCHPNKLYVARIDGLGGSTPTLSQIRRAKCQRLREPQVQ